MIKKHSIWFILFLGAVLLIFMGASPAQVKIQGKPAKPGKPPKDEEPPAPFSLAQHNLVTGDACGDLRVMFRIDGYVDYVEGWTGGSPDIDDYYSLQIAEVTGDSFPDLVAAGVIMGGRKDDFASKTILEIWSGDPDEETNPVFRHEMTDDRLEWNTRIEIGDVDGDGIADIVLKSRHQIDIFSADNFDMWWTHTLDANTYFAGLALGNGTDSGGREVIVGVREYDGSSYDGFLRVYTFDQAGNPLPPTVVDLGSHDPMIDCYYLEDIRTYDLNGNGILEILSTSQAHDYYHPLKKRLYSYFTHLHVWEKQGPVYTPLTDFAVNNLDDYLSIALFDVGTFADGTKAVVIGTHGGRDSTVTVLGWNDETEGFDELIHGPTPVVTGGTGGEIWAVTLDDVDGDLIDEIILSGMSADGGKYYVEIFEGFYGGMTSLWNRIEEACGWVRTHITN